MKVKAYITFNQFQTQSACSPNGATLKFQLFHVTTDSSITYKIISKDANGILDSTSGNTIPQTNAPQIADAGNESIGFWDSITGLSVGTHTIFVVDGNNDSIQTSISITNYLPYSVFFSKSNFTDTLFLDLVKDFCADSTGNSNSAEALIRSSTLFIQLRGGLANLNIPSGNYLINGQALTGSLSGYENFLSFVDCKDLNVHGPLVGPKPKFTFEGGQYYGFYNPNLPLSDPNSSMDNACSPSDSCNCNVYNSKVITPGSLFQFINCENIKVTKIQADGNKDAMISRGFLCPITSNSLNLKSWQIGASGLVIRPNGKNFEVRDCIFNEFCLDGVLINGSSLNYLTMDQNVGSPLVYNSFTDIVCNSNGRNGISISAGRYIKFKNCIVENTAQGSFGQTPAMGIDIEPDGPIDTTNGDPLACSQLVFDSCRVKNSLGTAFAIIWRKGDFANHFIPQDIVIRNNSYFADYDNNIIESPNSTVDASGANVVFENSTIIGSFWRGCNPLHNTDYPKFINVTFIEDDTLGPGGSYKNSGYLFYSDNLCENMSFDQCQFKVNRHARLARLIARYMNDSSKYSRFNNCDFIYDSTHQENSSGFSLFNGCVFLGNTHFINLSTNQNTWAKKIKTAGIILEGSLNPCQPSLFKLDNAITLTHMNSFLYDSTNVTLCGNVNLPFIIGPNLLISNNFIPSYANIEIPDNATFRASLYENYISGGCTSSTPPFLYIGSKGRFLMHGITNEPLFAAAITPILVQNEGQFILGPKSQVALYNSSILNSSGNSGTFYFDPSIVHPSYFPISSINMGSNCSYGLTNATNFTGLNPCPTNYDQIKWDDKFTVFYRLQNNPCAGNSLGSIQYLVKGGTGTYVIDIDGNTSSTNNNNLATGTHTFTVTDAVNTNCSFTFQFTITEPPALSWTSVQATNPSCTPGSDGEIIVNTTGGSGSVTITPTVLSSLNAGTYTIAATDANGCSLSTSVTLYQPNSNHCCSTNSNPNAGSNIALLANMILLPNTQVSTLNASALLANYGSGSVIQGKKFYVDGTLIIDDDITFNQCEIYFTSGSKITVNTGKNLHILQNSILQSSCNMWDGIYASNASSQIHIANSILKDMENGVVSTIGAKLDIVGSQFIDNYSSIQIIQAPVGFNSIGGSCQIQGNTFSGSGNPLRAPHANQSKPELGIRLSKCSEVEIGVLGNPGLKNTFSLLYNGIYIEPGAQNQAHDLKIYNNLFENIQDDIQPGFAYYSTLIGNTYTTHRGAGIYAVPYSVAPLNITSLHRIHVNGNQNNTSFDNCDKAIVTSYFGANIQNIKTSGTPLGFMFGNADGQWIEAGNFNTQLGGGQHNILNDVMIGIQVLGNTSKTFINDNEINLSGDYYQNGSINTLYYWAQGIVLRPFNAPSSPYQINQNQINIPNLGGTGISVSNAGKGLRLFNNEIHFKTTSAVPENSCAWCRAELVGIDMSNSREGYLESNKVFGFVDATGQPLANVFNERTAYGLRMYHSRDMALNCNETHKTRYGFYVVGDCSHADPLAVNGNVFDYHSSGMHFRHLGSEGTFGQIGDLNHDNNNQFNSSAIAFGSTQLKEIWRVTNSFFNDKIYTMQLTQNQSGSTIGLPGAYKPQFPNQNHTLLTCEDLPLEIIEEGLTSSQIGEALLVAGDSINYSEYNELSEWYDERQVYEWLKRDSIARVTYPLLNAFYANQESLLTDEIRGFDETLNMLCNESLLNDSTIFQNQIQELYLQNTSLPVGRLFENFEIQLNSIYLDILSSGWSSLSTGDVELLEDLALSCPFVNGSAVYKSRSLYAYLNPGISYDDLEICNSVGVYKNSLGESTITNKNENYLNILLYPNPSHTELIIKFPEFNGKVQIQVFDMTSLEVLNFKDITQNRKVILQVSNLNSGIYNIRIQCKQMVKYAKFIKI